MRIGTWNLNLQWREPHRDLLHKELCDVWLLTEVNRKVVDAAGMIAGFHCHLSAGVMDRRQHWAAILSRLAMTPLPDPHPASSAANIDGITYCSTILPWKGAPSKSPWVGSNHREKTQIAIETLLTQLPNSNLVWGGDWNHALTGKETAGSMGGRRHLIEAITGLNLQVPTAHLSHRLGAGNLTIDHIAVPTAWKVENAVRVVAECDGKSLSDHDAYVVEVALG